MIYLLQLQSDLGLYKSLNNINKSFQIVAMNVTDEPYKEIDFTDNHSLVIDQFNKMDGNKIILADTFILNTNIHNLINNG